MKVNQIVSEHKKGVRAMKYSKKTKGTVPVYGPKANDAKLKPVKPVGAGAKLDEAGIEIKPMPGAAQIQSDGKTIGTADAATANTIKQAVEKGALNLTNPNDPAAPNQGGTMEETNPNDIGGDPTDDYINDVTDHEFSQAQGREVEEAPEIPYQVKMGPKPMAMTSPAPTAIVASTKWTAITPEIQARAESQGFRKVMLKVNGQMVPGLEGGDQALGSKIIVAPSDFQQMSTPGAETMRRPMGVQSAEKTATPMRESDNVLLNKMLTIAGLK